MSGNQNVKNWKEHKRKLKQWKEEAIASKLAKKQALEQETNATNDDAISSGRSWTLSIAVPASIVDNAQSFELKNYLIGEIARAAVVFKCDEIVVYDEFCTKVADEEIAFNPKTRCVALMAKILQYLECPQYLRKYFFPLQKDLQFVGLLNPLDTPHHLRIEDVSAFREGVVVNKSTGKATGKSYANVGLRNDVKIDRHLKSGVRVTVELNLDEIRQNKKKLNGKVVSPNKPRETNGTYWGYTVRIADSLSAVLNQSSFEDDYDLTIGTSERGDNIDTTIDRIPNEFKHAIVVFGGLKGIEAAMDADVHYSNVDDPRKVFGYYVNTCPSQGSNTIRTEEAILITLSSLRTKLCTNK